MIDRSAVLVLCASLSVSCAGRPTGPDDMDFIGALRQQGAAVSHIETMPRTSFPFFSVNAERLSVNGEDVHVFEYPSDGSAERQAQLISPDGSSFGSTAISWVSTPSFYRRSSTIVLYVGRTSEIAKVLTNVLGPPFAGGI